MTVIRSFTNSDYHNQSDYALNNIHSTEFVNDKTERISSPDEFIKSSETTTQPMIFAEGTSKKVKSALNSYDANSVFIDGILNQPQAPIVVVTKRFMPDGSVEITTKKDGQVVDRTRKKPHMVSVRDPLTGKAEMKPFISVFDSDFM